jgi:hypothetical protein
MTTTVCICESEHFCDACLRDREAQTATEPTIQWQIQARLEACGLPYKEVKVYGSQIMITTWSDKAARKWYSLLFKLCTTVRPPGESRDYNKVNEGTNLLPTRHKVWRVWGTI